MTGGHTRSVSASQSPLRKAYNRASTVARARGVDHGVVRRSPTRLRRQDAPDHCREAAPVGALLPELPAPSLGNGIELRTSIRLGRTPLRANPASLLEAHEGRVDRSLIQEDMVAAALFDSACNAVSMLRPDRVEGLEDHEVQGSLQQIQLVASHRSAVWLGHRSVSHLWWYHIRLFPQGRSC